MRACVFCVLSLLFLLTACGGGGGDNPLRDQPVTEEPQPQPEPEPEAKLEARTLASGVQQLLLSQAGQSVQLHLLDDHLLHIHFANTETPPELPQLYSDMLSEDFSARGASELTLSGLSFSTAELAVTLSEDLCVSLLSLEREQNSLEREQNSLEREQNSPEQEPLTRVCPTDLGEPGFSLSLDPDDTNQAYGLGEQFFNAGQNGDWIGRRREAGTDYGNRMVGFEGGAVGNLQIPVLLTYQPGAALGYMLDSPQAQSWDMSGEAWSIDSDLGQANLLVFSGEDLADIRTDYMTLTGTPPVPPRAAFGLWVSEFGFDNWAEAESKVAAQHQAKMPIDGLVLDLQWFGGIRENPQMGSLTWDLQAFPNPAQRLQSWREDWGIRAMAIEESYIDQNTDKFNRLQDRDYMVRDCEDCEATFFADEWWGSGGMIDWTNRPASTYWHETARSPLIDDGLLGHWTDLGEPEIFNPDAWYADSFENNRHQHGQIHNLYNFYWTRSIFEGYQQSQPRARPWILSRSGTAGSQRFGAALWSGDIGTNSRSLAAHWQTQMHMSLSGIDYYGSDIGGFHRGQMAPEELDELYTLWLAGGALLDVPLRPHVQNLCNCKETAPALIGDTDSNRFNLQLRYRLFPYYYSLAHRAHEEGRAIFPPLAYRHPDDPEVHGLGEVKHIGDSLLARTYAEPSKTRLDTYLPQGDWINFHTGQWLASAGEFFALDGRFEGKVIVPLVARAGAVIPMMRVDEQTMNLKGQRRDGSRRDELIVWVAADEQPSSFTLVEDDGLSTDYLDGALARTRLRQEPLGGDILVTIEATEGRFEGSLTERGYEVELHLREDQIEAVQLNGEPLPLVESEPEYVNLEAGAFQVSEGHWRAKSATLSVTAEKRFRFMGP